MKEEENDDVESDGNGKAEKTQAKVKEGQLKPEALN